MPAKNQLQKDEKFEKTELDLFEILSAIDKKDYSYYDNLTEDQKKKFVPFMLTHWVSAVKAQPNVMSYYILSTNEYANKYLFNEVVSKHPKLQYLMLCSSSPGLGKQFHQWIPSIRDKVAKYKEPASNKEIKDYYTKIYHNAKNEDIQEITRVFISDHKRKLKLAGIYPNLKISDIEVLSNLITDADIEEYEKANGNA